MSTFSGPNKDRYGTFGSDAKERMTQILADPNCDPQPNGMPSSRK